MKITKLVRFDWAIKKLLRNKVNFSILEGFLAELLKEDLKIQEILESESNQDYDKDKFNRVDLLVKNSKDELIIIEIQNSREYGYFQRMAYGTSKAIVENIDVGQKYTSIKKVISVNIVYFELGQGSDYIYHGTTVFRGVHNPDDILGLSKKQKDIYSKQTVASLFPEYYVIKVNKFNDIAVDPLDEWVYFLKNSAIKSDFSAKGIKDAAKKLDLLKLPYEKRMEYNRFLRDLMDEASFAETWKKDEEDYYKDLQEGVEKRTKEIKEEILVLAKNLQDTLGKVEEKNKEVEAKNKEVEAKNKEVEAKNKEVEEIRAKSQEKEKQLVIRFFEKGIDSQTISELTGLELVKVQEIKNLYITNKNT